MYATEVVLTQERTKARRGASTPTGITLGKERNVTTVPRQCTQEGCDRPIRCKGYCTAHYMRKRLGMAMEPPIRPGARGKPTAVCKVEGCGTSVKGRGYCKQHYEERLVEPEIERLKAHTPEKAGPERWETVPGTEGLYEASTFGRVRRVAGFAISSNPARKPRMLRGRVLRSPFLGRYMAVGMSVRGRQQVKRVHKIVAETFLGPPPPGAVVNHIDNDPANNHLCNLEYVTQNDNLLHAVAIRRMAD